MKLGQYAPIDEGPVKIIRLAPNPDCRGGLTEIFRQEWLDGPVPVQWNLVQSGVNALRGVHVHLKHTDYVVLIKGRVQVGISDLRETSAGKSARVIDPAEDQPTMLMIPPGVAHGFYFSEPATMMVGVSRYWDPVHDEFGCRWDDPGLEIPWPASISPVLSERDRVASSLLHLLAALHEARQQ